MESYGRNRRVVRLLDDLPLEQARLFDFNDYATSIVDIVATAGNRTPLALAIDGPWGSGKTSLMRTAIRRLSPAFWDMSDPSGLRLDGKRYELEGEQGTINAFIRSSFPMIPAEILLTVAGHLGALGDKSLRIDDDLFAALKNFRPVRTVAFNAWRYRGEEQILPALLRELLAQIKRDNWLVGASAGWTMHSSEAWQAFFSGLAQKVPYVGDVLQQVAKSFDFGGKLEEEALFDQFKPYFSGLLGLWSSIQNPGSQKLPKYFEEFLKLDLGSDILERAKEIWGLRMPGPDLESPPGVLALFIDDLDRCPEEHVREVLKSLNLVVDFPGCVYVLGMDTNRVARLIGRDFSTETDEAEVYGRDFLRKIIQVAFRLPEPRVPAVEDFIGSALREIDAPTTGPYCLHDQASLMALSLVPNPREIKRFINQVVIQVGLYESLPGPFLGYVDPEAVEEVKERLFRHFLGFLLLQSILDGEELYSRPDVIEESHRFLARIPRRVIEGEAGAVTDLELHAKDGGGLVKLLAQAIAGCEGTKGILQQVDRDLVRYERVVRLLVALAESPGREEEIILTKDLMSSFARFAAPVSGLVFNAWDQDGYRQQEKGGRRLRLVEMDWYLNATDLLLKKKHVDSFARKCEGQKLDSSCIPAIKRYVVDLDIDEQVKLAKLTQDILVSALNGSALFSSQALGLAMALRDVCIEAISRKEKWPEKMVTGSKRDQWIDPFNNLFWDLESTEIRKAFEDWSEEGEGAIDVNALGGRTEPILVTEEGAGDDWVLVSAGHFIAGGIESEDEGPVRVEYTGRPYWIMRRPVTVEMFEEFVQDGYDFRHSCWRVFDSVVLDEILSQRHPGEWKQQLSGSSDAPVVGVSWVEAVAYCLWRSEKEDSVIRLPTEGEWEKATRGLWGRRFPWGSSIREGNVNYARSDQQGGRELVSSSEDARNWSPYSLLETAGNVAEWTSSRYRLSGFDNLEWGRRLWQSLNKEQLFVYRGGSYLDSLNASRCSARAFVGPQFGFADRGFRCVREALVKEPV